MEPILFDHAAATPGVRIFNDTVVVGVDQTSDGVCAEATRDGSLVEVPLGWSGSEKTNRRPSSAILSCWCVLTVMWGGEGPCQVIRTPCCSGDGKSLSIEGLALAGRNVRADVQRGGRHDPRVSSSAQCTDQA